MTGHEAWTAKHRPGCKVLPPDRRVRGPSCWSCASRPRVLQPQREHVLAGPLVQLVLLEEVAGALAPKPYAGRHRAAKRRLCTLLPSLTVPLQLQRAIRASRAAPAARAPPAPRRSASALASRSLAKRSLSIGSGLAAQLARPVHVLVQVEDRPPRLRLRRQRGQHAPRGRGPARAPAPPGCASQSPSGASNTRRLVNSSTSRARRHQVEVARRGPVVGGPAGQAEREGQVARGRRRRTTAAPCPAGAR